MNPSFEVPAQYFYALAPNLPQDVSADVRYRMACLADEKQIVDQLRKAIDAGIISADSDVTPEMAARRLRDSARHRGQNRFVHQESALPWCRHTQTTRPHPPRTTRTRTSRRSGPA